MNRLLKNALLITTCLNANASFAECDTDPELKLIRFTPSGLSAYVPKNTVINGTVYDGPENFDAIYDIIYKSQEIAFHISHQPEYFDYPFYENIKLPNINDTARLLRKECGDRICATAYPDLKNEGYANDVEFYYNNSITYDSASMEESKIGDVFVKSLFVDKSHCIAAEPDSLIYNGPSEIRAFYFDANSAVIPSKYYDNEKFKHFTSNVSRKNYNIIIEGHTGKNEIESVNGSEDYSISLSRKRAESFRDFLISDYGMNPDIQVDIQAKGTTLPVASSKNEEEAKMNHRVRAYIDTRSLKK